MLGRQHQSFNYGTAAPGYGSAPNYGQAPGYGYGGQPARHHSHRGPPPGADPQLWTWFSSVDADRSGSISATELQAALVNGDWSNFDLDTVKMLMSIFDTDRSGTIGFNEFAGLWKYISDWQGVFRHFDVDRSGSIDGHELANALRSFGYNLTPQILSLLEQKYGSLWAIPLDLYLNSYDRPSDLRYSDTGLDRIWPTSWYHIRPICTSMRCCKDVIRIIPENGYRPRRLDYDQLRAVHEYCPERTLKS